ncbi:Acetylpolyamine aminohydrolase [compost metagenome]
MDVSTAGFGRLGRAVAALGLPTLVVQEGGYHLDSLAANATAFFGGIQQSGTGV